MGSNDGGISLDDDVFRLQNMAVGERRRDSAVLCGACVLMAYMIIVVIAHKKIILKMKYNTLIF